MLSVSIIFITHNRIEYTKKSLAALLKNDEDFHLHIWDNGSDDGTVEYLSEIEDPRIRSKVFREENEGQTIPLNKIWSFSKSDLMGKVDNDCLMPDGWLSVFSKAHEDIENLGAVACWHYHLEDFDYDLAKNKIFKYGDHSILRNAWVGGTGFLIKRDSFERVGPIRRNSLTKYWIKMASKGYINGFYYPLLHQEHMDDPRSEYTLLKDDSNIEKYLPVTAKNFGVSSVDQWMEFLKKDAKYIQKASYDPGEYAGMKAKAKRLYSKVLQRQGK